jgi:hypothetical protein
VFCVGLAETRVSFRIFALIYFQPLVVGLRSEPNLRKTNDRLLRVIALFKFLKAASLIALGIGAFRFLHKDLGGFLEHWTMALGLDPGNRFVDATLAKASNLSPEQIKKLGLGSFLYAALFLAEGRASGC